MSELKLGDQVRWPVAGDEAYEVIGLGDGCFFVETVVDIYKYPWPNPYVEKVEPPLIDPETSYEVLLNGNCMNAVEGIGLTRAATVIRITGYEIVKQRNV